MNPNEVRDIRKKAPVVSKLIEAKRHQDKGSLAYSLTEMLLEPHRRVYQNYGSPHGDTDEGMLKWYNTFMNDDAKHA